eukprot:sb/3474711/
MGSKASWSLFQLGCQLQSLLVGTLNLGGDQLVTDKSKQPIITSYLGHVNTYQPIRDQYFLIWFLTVEYYTGDKQPIRIRYLGHVTGYQPIRDHETNMWPGGAAMWSSVQTESRYIRNRPNQEILLPVCVGRFLR